MNKISGILPANSRVTTVDMKNSGVARSGSPSFGREVGVSSVTRRRSALETGQKANVEFLSQTQLRDTKEDPKTKIVQDMADRFFQNKNRQIDEDINLGLDSSTDMVIEAPPIEVEVVPREDFSTVGLKATGLKSTGSMTESEGIPISTRAVALPIQSNEQEPGQDDDAPAVGSYLDVRV